MSDAPDSEEKKSAPVPLLLFFDLIGWIFIGFEATAALFFIEKSAAHIFAYHGWLGVLIASPLLFGGALLSVCVVLFLFRLITPRVPEGTYPFPMSSQARAWTLQLFVSRLPQTSALRPFFMGSSLIRFLFLRILGAKVAYRITTAGDAWIVDPSLTEIGEGAVITGSTIISCHSATSRNVILKRTKIGKRAQILFATTVGPGCQIGDHSTIGAYNRLTFDVTVGERAYIGYQSTVEDGVVIGNRALIGNRVIIEKGCRIGNRAVIASDTFVPKGTVIADGERYPARPN